MKKRNSGRGGRKSGVETRSLGWAIRMSMAMIGRSAQRTLRVWGYSPSLRWGGAGAWRPRGVIGLLLCACVNLVAEKLTAAVKRCPLRRGIADKTGSLMASAGVGCLVVEERRRCRERWSCRSPHSRSLQVEECRRCRELWSCRSPHSRSLQVEECRRCRERWSDCWESRCCWH